MEIKEKLLKLREKMKENRLDAYIVNTSDPHQSEYVADRYKSRIWISGFTGSAGTAVITMDKALLWTDGRYFIQAEDELKGTGYHMMKMGIPGEPTYQEWLLDNLEESSTIGYCAEVFPQKDIEELEKSFGKKSINLKGDFDLIGEIWQDRPEIPAKKIFIHEKKYTGKDSGEKLKDLRDLMTEKGVKGYLLASLDDIAWLYNVRGRDVKNNPVVISYAYIDMDKAYFFLDKNKLTEESLGFLTSFKIEVRDYDEIYDFLGKLDLDGKIYLDKSRINAKLFGQIPEGIEIVNGINLTTLLKGVKNSKEIENQKNAYIKDGIALTKFLYWLDKNIGEIEITELSAQEKLLDFRKEQEDFIEPSFDTISAYRENAAMMHYSASEDSYKTLEKAHLYLVDSGGQYLDGTTDITRTVALGPISEEERTDFTLTLKGLINLSGARFLYGSTGHSLDALARYPLWQHGIDYKCGTGHGVGFLLNVHEGPHGISTVHNPVRLEEGMIVSIEPGVYKSSKHGIRIENIVVVKKDIKTDSGQFMAFETLSYVPIDLNCIDKNLLLAREIEWLNKYHQEVYNKLSAYLDEDEKKWLKEKTKEIV